MKNIQEITSRYVLPTVEEKTAYGYKRQDPYTKLFEERIIFLGQPIDDTVANDVMAQLLTLESMDPDRDIMIYINSPGGSFTALTAIYDTMQFVRPDISTICLGQAASAAAVILAGGAKGKRYLAGGAKGKRYALEHSRILIHQPSSEGGGQASDIEIQAREIDRITRLQEDLLSRHVVKSAAEIRKDIERDKILTATEAVEYGIIDQVLASRKAKK
ncbi:MAG: ATP-dependent Clp protease, protease subunit [Actinomycetota bacterium]